MSEIFLTSDDNNSVVYAEVNDTIKIILMEAATTGYTWAFDGVIAPIFEVLFNDYKVTYKKAMGGEGKRVVELLTKRKGTTKIRLKYWKEWMGDTSVKNTFEITLIIE